MAGVLEKPQTPTRHRIDVEAYYKMAEVGIIARELRVELIDGEIIDMAAMGSPHAEVANRLVRLLARAVTDDTALLNVQTPLRLDNFNEPEPDLMLLRPRTGGYRSGHPGAADVLLLVEVSDTSLAYDRGRKLALYARFGVPEIWIVDIAGAAVEVFREPKYGAYSWSERRTGGMLSPSLVPAVTIDLAALVA